MCVCAHRVVRRFEVGNNVAIVEPRKLFTVKALGNKATGAFHPDVSVLENKGPRRIVLNGNTQ